MLAVYNLAFLILKNDVDGRIDFEWIRPRYAYKKNVQRKALLFKLAENVSNTRIPKYQYTDFIESL